MRVTPEIQAQAIFIALTAFILFIAIGLLYLWADEQDKKRERKQRRNKK